MQNPDYKKLLEDEVFDKIPIDWLLKYTENISNEEYLPKTTYLHKLIKNKTIEKLNPKIWNTNTLTLTDSEGKTILQHLLENEELDKLPAQTLTKELIILELQRANNSVLTWYIKKGEITKLYQHITPDELEECLEQKLNQFNNNLFPTTKSMAIAYGNYNQIPINSTKDIDFNQQLFDRHTLFYHCITHKTISTLPTRLLIEILTKNNTQTDILEIIKQKDGLNLIPRPILEKTLSLVKNNPYTITPLGYDCIYNEKIKYPITNEFLKGNPPCHELFAQFSHQQIDLNNTENLKREEIQDQIIKKQPHLQTITTKKWLKQIFKNKLNHKKETPTK
jgi:hypothetical protein